MSRVAGKVALVTGAGTGIGRATATRLHEEGAKVFVTDIDASAAQATAEALGDGAASAAQDVRDELQWQTVMSEVHAAFGQLDIQVNNAGILAPAGSQGVEDTDLEHWRGVQQVNVEGVYLGCRFAVETMKQRGGSIINLSSVAGLIGTPQLFAYGASKGAVRQLTKSVAVHCGRSGYRIRCNSVHPGVIETQMGNDVFKLGGANPDQARELRKQLTPLGHLGEAQDVANCILFLASDEARYVTGAELVVDGGMTAI